MAVFLLNAVEFHLSTTMSERHFLSTLCQNHNFKVDKPEFQISSIIPSQNPFQKRSSRTLIFKYNVPEQHVLGTMSLSPIFEVQSPRTLLEVDIPESHFSNNVSGPHISCAMP